MLQLKRKVPIILHRVSDQKRQNVCRRISQELILSQFLGIKFHLILQILAFIIS